MGVRRMHAPRGTVLLIERASFVQLPAGERRPNGVLARGAPLMVVVVR